MLGVKKSLPLWRRRHSNLLALERALAAGRQTDRHTDTEHTVLGQKAARRRMEQSKGKIHPTG